MLHLLPPNYKPSPQKKSSKNFMERSSNNSMNNNAFMMTKNETMTFSGEETPEESSWTMYFEDDFFFKDSVSIATEDCSSSSVSDAASFVGTKKISIMNQEGSKKFKMKRRRDREEVVELDLEDTASSPSHSPNVCSMMKLLDNNNNTRHVGGDVSDDTINEMIMQNRGGLSIDLKKKGLCLVPLSMVTNFLG